MAAAWTSGAVTALKCSGGCGCDRAPCEGEETSCVTVVVVVSDRQCHSIHMRSVGHCVSQRQRRACTHTIRSSLSLRVT